MKWMNEGMNENVNKGMNKVCILWSLIRIFFCLHLPGQIYHNAGKPCFNLRFFGAKSQDIACKTHKAIVYPLVEINSIIFRYMMFVSDLAWFVVFSDGQCLEISERDQTSCYPLWPKARWDENWGYLCYLKESQLYCRFCFCILLQLPLPSCSSSLSLSCHLLSLSYSPEAISISLSFRYR